MQFNINYGLARANLPLIPVEIQNKSLCFLLDTGSNLNYIETAVYEYFKEVAELVGECDHYGTEGNKTQGITARLSFLFESQTYAPIFSVADMDKAFSMVYEESGIPIHGILGNMFFIEHKWVLNFDKLELCFG